MPATAFAQSWYQPDLTIRAERYHDPLLLETVRIIKASNYTLTEIAQQAKVSSRTLSRCVRWSYHVHMYRRCEKFGHFSAMTSADRCRNRQPANGTDRRVACCLRRYQRA